MLVMCLSNDCYIRVIHSLMTVLLEYIYLEYSLLKMFVRFKFNESNSNICFSLSRKAKKKKNSLVCLYDERVSFLCVALL